MPRLTQPAPGGGYTLPENTAPAQVLQRLGFYEDYHQALLENQQKLADELEALRAAGKKNSARFREKLGEKLMGSNTLLELKMRGIE